MAGELVTVDNFVRAETNRMFAGRPPFAVGKINTWHHAREPTRIDAQGVIRMNRDTLYSSAVVDIDERAVVTIPDAGDRYLSVAVVNQDHYVNAIFHEPGDHGLTIEELETPYVAVVARILVDPRDPQDAALVNALQDRLELQAGSARPFVMPEYDAESFDRTRGALLELARGGFGGSSAFGRRGEVDPVHHLIGTAAGWGGLPPAEASYVGVDPNLPGDGEYTLTVPRDVPVDGFWSISVYNADGFFEPNHLNAYSVNNITAVRNDDGSVSVNFGGCGVDRPNCIPIVDGWNYTVRMYRPRAEVLDGSWSFPTIDAR